MIVKMSVMGILVMGNAPFRFGSHLNLEDIPSFRQSFFNFTSDVLYEEIWQAFEVLVQQGKVIYSGSSNFAGWQIALAQSEAQKRNFMGLVSEQSLYNLRDRMIELEVIPACRHFGLGIIPWSPLAGGVLGGALEKAATGRRAGEGAQKAIEKHRRQIEQYEEFCREIGEKPGEVALAWLLQNPMVTAPIVGPRTSVQLEASAHALEIKLDEAAQNRLDEIWPGPGGEAPMAYAW
jgi:aryl-alcohol dehydrogenase-like predicted oxidoreductase